ncbi:MAG TPA: tetratricopeptide repeat protein [Bryobacteraceae bacterium]|nr:tetratricopeptide repeat protein [Bryobacteraceae bacterium]
MVSFVVCGILLAQAPAVEQAWKLAANGERSQAIVLLNGVVRGSPADADARLLLGSLLVESGQREEAIAQLTEAAHLRPGSAEAQNALGEAYASFGSFPKARQPFEKAVALNPNFGVAQLNLGRALLDAHEFDAAAGHLDRAIRVLAPDADAASAHYLRAKVYTSRNDAGEALKELQKALSIRSDFPEAWSDLGQARKTLFDAAGALAAFQRAVELAPDDSVAQYRLGAQYLLKGQPHLAVGPLEQAYRLTPDDQAILNALQRAARQAGKLEEAENVKRKLAEVLLKLNESFQNELNATELNNEGARLQRAGDLPGALEKYRAAVQLFPPSVPMRVNYAAALLHLRQWTDGINELHKAHQMDPFDEKISAALKSALAQAPAGTIPQWSDQPLQPKH